LKGKINKKSSQFSKLHRVLGQKRPRMLLQLTVYKKWEFKNLNNSLLKSKRQSLKLIKQKLKLTIWVR
jgi:hypothetical protein